MSLSYTLSGAAKHCLIGLPIWLALAAFDLDAYAATFITGAFLFREIARAEYEWIRIYAFGKRTNMPWHAGFTDRSVWDRKSMCDWIIPSVVYWCLTALKAI